MAATDTEVESPGTATRHTDKFSLSTLYYASDHV